MQEHARRRVRVHGAGKGKGKGKEKEGADELGHGKRAASTGAEDGARKKVKTGKEGADATVVQKMDAETPPGATHDLSLRSKTTYAIPDFVDRPLRMPPTPPAPLPRPKLLEYLSLGINEVTRALETRVRWGRWELGDPTAAPGGGLGAASVRQVEGSVDEGDVLLKKNEKKTRRKDRPTPPADKQVLRPPLDLLHPTSSKTLSRPSYRFLTQGVYAPSSTSLPPYLLPPTEPNPFFRMLANAHQEEVKSKSGSTEAQKPSKRKATVLLPDVMLADDIDSAKEEAARRKVEKQLAKGSKKAVARVQVGAEADEEQKDDWVPVLDIIFVCKPDINPPSLVAHLPTMAAAANGVQQALDATLAANERERTTSGAADDAMDTENSATPRPKGQNVLLIPLDVGAERKLADALALRRVAAIGLSVRSSSTMARCRDARADLLTCLPVHRAQHRPPGRPHPPTRPAAPDTLARPAPHLLHPESVDRSRRFDSHARQAPSDDGAAQP